MIAKKNTLIVERLTALWALNECGLGGFMHAFGSPFTGILVGGISILMISLIALYAENSWKTILKALAIVLLVKLTVSPHSPVPAYFAVTFQALLGGILFSLFSVKPFSILLLGVVTFLESALQKLFTLTIVYGATLWDAIDQYGEWVGAKLEFIPFALSSKMLVLFFLSFYILAGAVIAYLIVKVITIVQTPIVSSELYIPKFTSLEGDQSKSVSVFRSNVLFWVITAILILISLLFFSNDDHGWQKGVYVLARSFFIISVWYLLLAPLLLKLIRSLVFRNKNKYAKDVQHTLDLLPYLNDILRYSWKESKSYRGFNRVQVFLAKSIIYSIHFKIDNR